MAAQRTMGSLPNVRGPERGWLALHLNACVAAQMVMSDQCLAHVDAHVGSIICHTVCLQRLQESVLFQISRAILPRRALWSVVSHVRRKRPVPSKLSCQLALSISTCLMCRLSHDYDR